MDALHRIHAALEPGGLMIDTQPVSARPPLEVDGVAVGTLDMRAWRATIDAIDGLTGEVVEEGRYALDVERSIVVTDAYDSAAEFLDLVQELRETESSKFTLRDTPMYTCRRSTIEEIVDSLA